MNIINKFEGLNLNSEDKIPKEDIEYCKILQEIYKNTLSVYQQWYEIYHKFKSTEIENNGNFYGLQLDDLNICKKILNTHSSFISKIYNYFINKYKIEIEQYSVKESDFDYSYGNHTIDTNPLDYKTYTDKILRQLNGLSFRDLRVTQLKERVKNACTVGYSGDKWKIQITANTIKFDNLIYWSLGWNGKYRTDNVTNFKTILSALGWFEHGKEINFIQLNSFYKYSCEWEEIQEKTEINSNKISFIKFYKNGRVDMKFKKPELARQFISEWCGYSLESCRTA